jgi:hypothetical protein
VKPENEFEKLEHALAQAGRAISYPAMPVFAARVREELDLEQPRHRTWQLLPRLFLRPRTGLAVALTLVIALALLVSPETRGALAQLLGVGSARVAPTASMPTLIATATPNPLASTTITSAPATQTATVLPTHASTPLSRNDKFGKAMTFVLGNSNDRIYTRTK